MSNYEVDSTKIKLSEQIEAIKEVITFLTGKVEALSKQVEKLGGDNSEK